MQTEIGHLGITSFPSKAAFKKCGKKKVNTTVTLKEDLKIKSDASSKCVSMLTLRVCCVIEGVGDSVD